MFLQNQTFIDFVLRVRDIHTRLPSNPEEFGWVLWQDEQTASNSTQTRHPRIYVRIFRGTREDWHHIFELRAQQLNRRIDDGIVQTRVPFSAVDIFLQDVEASIANMLPQDTFIATYTGPATIHL